MYCPKCGTENPDGTSICRNCSFALISTGPAAVPASRTSALAITSLVLGLLSFCTFFLTAPLAIIFGIISLIMIARSHGQLKGIGMAIAGIAVPVVILPLVAILMGILLPALNSVRIAAQKVICANNMTALGKAMHVYAGDYDGKFPISSKWCDLLIEHADVDEHMFRCPAASGYNAVDTSQRICSYAMNENVEDVDAPGDMVLLFETDVGWNQSGGREMLITTDRHRNGGCNVLFVDGSVELVRIEDINKLRWTAEQ
jgi:prepilin-type processing-associated H-X9-DG protein